MIDKVDEAINQEVATPLRIYLYYQNHIIPADFLTEENS